MKSNEANRVGGKTAPPEPESFLATDKIVIDATRETIRAVPRKFPGPRQADAALRVAFERRAYAELLAHAKESLEVEVCGVLAGEVCEDEEGLFVHVSAAVRGTAATEASTHVTFTQATWNAIHQTLERDYPKLKIVGWYHTHPGFGVEFSDMDLFIQKNFFGGSTQIAMVTDPLSGDVGLCVNTAQGPRYLPRFWVDGREQPCRVPARGGQKTVAEGLSSASADSTRNDIARLEARISQLIQVVDEERARHHHLVLFCGFIFCLAVIGGVGYFIFKTYTSRLEPPRFNSMVPIPIQVGDKRVMVGVALAEWDVPDELNALLLQAAQEASKREKEAIDSTNAPAGATNSVNPSPPSAPRK